MSEDHCRKLSAPAALRNRGPIGAVLREELPASGLVLEIASGTGEHAVHFSRAFPALQWQPSDAEPAALASIAAWREEALAEGSDNLLPPIELDVCSEDWPPAPVAAIVCINMVHISPREATVALFTNAGRLLEPGAPLVLYGPYLEEETPTAPSNRAFDQSLRMRNPRWGLRHTFWIDELAAKHSLARTRRATVPANNLMLVYRKKS